MNFLRLVSFLLALFGILVVGRYVQARYFQGQSQANLKDAVGQVQKDVISVANQLDNHLGKVLGEKDTQQGISSYVRQELPQDIQEQIKKSEVVQEIQKEVNEIITNTTENIQELPKKEVNKLKKDISAEICKQVLEKQED